MRERRLALALEVGPRETATPPRVVPSAQRDAAQRSAQTGTLRQLLEVGARARLRVQPQRADRRSLGALWREICRGNSSDVGEDRVTGPVVALRPRALDLLLVVIRVAQGRPHGAPFTIGACGPIACVRGGEIVSVRRRSSYGHDGSAVLATAKAECDLITPRLNALSAWPTGLVQIVTDYLLSLIHGVPLRSVSLQDTVQGSILVAVSHDGTRLALGSHFRESIVVFDTGNGKPLARLQVTGLGVQAFCFAGGSSKRLLVGGDGGTLPDWTTGSSHGANRCLGSPECIR